MTQEQSQHDPEEPKKSDGFLQSYRDLAPYLGLGFQLAAAVVFFFFVGSWIDDRYGTGSLYKLIGLLVGVVGGFIKFFKTVSDLGKDKKS